MSVPAFSRIEVRVASIACFLPCKENQNAVYAGITASSKEQDNSLTPDDCEMDRAKEVEIQKTDAESRNTVWLAEGPLSGMRIHTSFDDAEGEPDLDFKTQSSVTCERLRSSSPNLDPTQVVETQMAYDSGVIDETLNMNSGICTAKTDDMLIEEQSACSFAKSGEIFPCGFARIHAGQDVLRARPIRSSHSLKSQLKSGRLRTPSAKVNDASVAAVCRSVFISRAPAELK